MSPACQASLRRSAAPRGSGCPFRGSPPWPGAAAGRGSDRVAAPAAKAFSSGGKLCQCATRGANNSFNLKIGYCGSFINKLPLPSSKFQPGCDRQEAARPGGQGGPASTEPAAAQKRITPARARGRLAARHSEALLCAAAPERARLRDRLVQLLAEARAARQESRPTLDKYVHPQLTRKVSEGLLRFHRGCAQSEHVATTRSRRRQVVGGKARRS